MLSDSSHAIQPESRAGRWLEERRTRIAIWIAVLESLVVLFSADVTKWTVIVLAAVAVTAWVFGRNSRSHVVRETLWILAASQLMAALAAVLGFIVKWALITIVIVGAVLALIYLFLDRRSAE